MIDWETWRSLFSEGYQDALNDEVMIGCYTEWRGDAYESGYLCARAVIGYFSTVRLANE